VPYCRVWRTEVQTDGQTPGRWLRRAKHYMLSRVKIQSRAISNTNIISKQAQNNIKDTQKGTRIST